MPTNQRPTNYFFPKLLFYVWGACLLITTPSAWAQGKSKIKSGIAGKAPEKQANIPFTWQEQGFRERAKIIVDLTADQYTPPSKSIGDPEKYYWPKAFARFEKYGLDDTMANNWVNDFHNHPPFHFVYVGTTRLLYRYAAAPMVAKHKKSFLKNGLKRTDSYNAFTGEGTENHISMSRTSGYLYAQAALDYPEEFPDAPKQLAQMKEWLGTWSKRIYEVGTGEWNSGIYQVYNMLGWFNVYDFAKDPEVKAMARAVLDYYTTEMALHYSYGIAGGAEMRGHGVGQGYYSSYAYLGWLWFSEGEVRDNIVNPQPGEFIQTMHAITSSYRPPVQLLPLAWKKPQTAGIFKNSRPEYHLDKGNHIKDVFYHNGNYTIGTTYMPYGGFTGTTAQVVSWKIVTPDTGSNMPFEVSGNGRYFDNWQGKARNPFTQIVQHKNTIIQLTRTPENVKEITLQANQVGELWQYKWREDFQERFPDEVYKANVVKMVKPQLFGNESYLSLPKGINITQGKTVTWAKVGQVYLMIRSLGQTLPSIELDTVKDRLILFDKAPLGKVCGFVVEVLEQRTREATPMWQNKMASSSKMTVAAASGPAPTVNYTTTDKVRLKAVFQTQGNPKEALVDWGYGVKSPMATISSPPFTQPDWPGGDGGGRVATLFINGKRQYEPNENWPVFSGKGLVLGNGKLSVNYSSTPYTVDYTGKVPSFSAQP